MEGDQQPPPPPPLRGGVQAVLLDVNGTLFSPGGASAGAFVELGLAPAADNSSSDAAAAAAAAATAAAATAVERWFAATLRDGMAAQAAGRFVSFRDVGAHQLRCLRLGVGEGGGGAAAAAAADGGDNDDENTDDEAIRHVVESWAAAPLYPDVAPALSALDAGGVVVAVLTNGSAELVARPLLAAGGALASCKGPLLDIAMAQHWKPFAAAYYVKPQVCMVASHAWDVHGAMRAGLRGVHVRRDQGPWPAYLQPPPDAVVQDFAGLAELLLPPAAAAAAAKARVSERVSV